MRELLGQYISDTLSYVHTVKEFCDRHPRWILQRKEEQSKMKNIKEMSDRIDLKFSRVLNAEDKTKALGEFTKDYLTQVTANRRLKELEKELEAVLKDTLNGLEELDCFMDAVERLVVTSLFVFADENRLCPLPQGREQASVRAVITSARMACPLLIHFKRDASAFFSPCLLNVEVLHVYLENYMNISEQLCERMGLGKTKTFCREKNDNLMSDTSPELTITLRAHISDHSSIPATCFNVSHEKVEYVPPARMDQHLRLTFMFQESALRFIGLFSQCHSRMLDFIKELERRAGKLDKMKKGGYISSVVGSAVGATGGALTIAGLCLAPVTAGLSLGLTIAGIGMGVTSGVNSLTTGVTKVVFKSYQNKKANTIFQCFMEDMQRLHGSLEKVASNICPLEPKVVALVVGKNIGKGGASLGKKINGIVKNTSAIEALMGKGVVIGAGKVGLQEGKTFAADLPDIGMLAQGTPLALSRTLRRCAVASNALFIGLDIITICKDSVSLAKGSKSKRSQLIRARAALWRTEIDSCQRIHDSLCRGIWRFRKSQRILEKPFYLVKEFESLEPLVQMGLMEQPEDDIETLVQPMDETRLLGQPMEETRLLGQPMEEIEKGTKVVKLICP
ncbi:uncharacterized protein LOC129835048 [Salvelinus fontinalis]|uniref:uncharacterized protein LOC129835048 n=1 Tax=Salvelinus fontinalis TaxID=8038 RepID=UPI0024860E67|nr:uncharacterized protein LOC129835048 [Salvelinus fontinalis]